MIKHTQQKNRLMINQNTDNSNVAKVQAHIARHVKGIRKLGVLGPSIKEQDMIECMVYTVCK